MVDTIQNVTPTREVSQLIREENGEEEGCEGLLRPSQFDSFSNLMVPQKARVRAVARLPKALIWRHGIPLL
jgi:hypothetical protein